MWRPAQVAGVAVVTTAVGLGGAGPASAATNTFSSQWGDVVASGQVGALSWKVALAPGQDNFNGLR